MHGFDGDRIQRLRSTMEGHAQDDTVAGVAWLAARGDQVETGVAGVLTRGESAPVQRDSVFRISSMTKPIVAACALVLVEECLLRLEDPVDELLPELADRRVLVDAQGPLDGETVPAERPITVHDVLTFRLGLGMDFSAPWPQPLFDAMGELGLGAGPPAPQEPPEPDEWMRRLCTLPLVHQPGERWLYNTGAHVLGVLIARAAGRPLAEVLADRVLEPLGMVDTGFFAAQPERFGTCYGSDPSTGERFVYDAPDGQWATAPAFPSGGAGLVSTLDDLCAFGRMLLAGGRRPDGERVLSRTAVEAMTTDQVGGDGPSPDGSQGWGLGVGVTLRRTGIGPSVGSYGWGGGLGSSWSNDPNEDLVGVMFTTDAFTAPSPPPAIIQDFWTGVYAALAD